MFAPATVAIPWLLALIMLGMGMTLQSGDFAIVARRPGAMLLGVTAQYVVMPLLAWGIATGLSCHRSWPRAWCWWAVRPAGRPRT